MEWWLWLGIASYLSYAISTSLDKHFMNKKYEPLSTNAFKMLFDGMILLVAGMLFFSVEFSGAVLWWALLLGLIYAAAGIFYFKALQQEDVHVLMPYSQSSQIILIFAGAIIFLRESVSFANIAGVAAMVLGVSAILSPRLFQFPHFKKGLLLMSFNTILTVAYSLLVKKILEVLPASPITVAIGMYFSTTLFMVIYLLLAGDRKNGWFGLEAKSASIFISALFGAGGTLLLYLALAAGKAVQIYPLAGLHVVFVFFFAVLLLKEKFSWTRLMGTLMVFAGIFLLAQ